MRRSPGGRNGIRNIVKISPNSLRLGSFCDSFTLAIEGIAGITRIIWCSSNQLSAGANNAANILDARIALLD